jgi:phage tail-like protein
MTRFIASRDANNATWYVLRYAPDFTPRTDPTIPGWMSPALDPTLFYDPDRHVLELLPGKPAAEAEPLPGLAIDVDGSIYEIDKTTGRVLQRCGTHVRELVGQHGVIGSAAGLALDRRGLLYIADPPAHRVLVVIADDGSLAGALAGGLEEPIDIAVSPDGWIFVADREGGRIVVFSSQFDRCGEFVPKDGNGVIGKPRPIAVMVDAEGGVLVADAFYPRLLRFTRRGQLLGEAEPHAIARNEEELPVALDALEKSYGKTLPRFYAGTCGPCRPARDGGDRLAAVHRALRLVRLSLGHDFAPCGTFVSAALDGGSPGVEWHKIEIDADVPDGTWLKLQTVTADNPDDLEAPALIPTVDEDADLVNLEAPAFVPFEDSSCAIRPRMPSRPSDRLVFSPPGRFLRLRVVLGSDGSATPSVRAIRVFYPRASYLDLLPRVYRRDAHSAFFLEHFLALFEHVFTAVEDRYELFTRQLNPDAAPLDVINWLACLIDLSFDPSWPLERRRALVAAAMDLYETRGTPQGLVRYVEIYTGIRPVILEAFLERPSSPPLLGLPGIRLGCNTHLASAMRKRTPEELLLQRWAHRFTMLVFLEDECDEEVTLAVIDRIVRVNKPAHTVHTLHAIRADARVGAARVGVDVMLGARQAGRTRLGGCTMPDRRGDPGSVIGSDAILGEKRPSYARPIGVSI